jgi:hypothetical protein
MKPWETYSSVRFSAMDGYSRPAYVLPYSHRFSEYRTASQAVDQLAFTEADWDGFGGIPINAATQANAKVALRQLEAGVSAPQVTPNSSGTFSFEWETNYGSAHLEIGRTKYSFYVRPIVGNPHFSRGHVNQLDPTLGFIVDEALFPKAFPSLNLR